MNSYFRLFALLTALVLVGTLSAQNPFPGTKPNKKNVKKPKSKVFLPKNRSAKPSSSASLPSSRQKIQKANSKEISRSEPLKVPFSKGQVITLRSALQNNLYVTPRNGITTSKSYVSVHNHVTKRFDARTRSWILEDAGDGYFYLKLSNDKVMDVKLGSANSRTSIWLYRKNGSDAQKFRFLPAEGGAYYIIPKVNPNLVLDVKGGSTQNGTGIWTYSLNRTPAQRFFIEDVSPTAPLKRYKIQLDYLQCLEEDDPGSEIELYGFLKAKVFYDGDDYRVYRNQEKKFWYRSEHNPIDLYEGDIYHGDRGQGSEDDTFIYVTEEDFNQGKVSIGLIMGFWEHDIGPKYKHDRMSLDGLTVSGTLIQTSESAFQNRGLFTLRDEYGDTKVYVAWKVVAY